MLNSRFQLMIVRNFFPMFLNAFFRTNFALIHFPLKVASINVVILDKTMQFLPSLKDELPSEEDFRFISEQKDPVMS